MDHVSSHSNGITRWRFMFIPIGGRFPFWRSYFSDGWSNHQLAGIQQLRFFNIFFFWGQMHLLYKDFHVDYPWQDEWIQSERPSKMGPKKRFFRAWRFCWGLILPSYMGIIMSHEKDSLLNNQDSMENKAGVSSWIQVWFFFFRFWEDHEAWAHVWRYCIAFYHDYAVYLVTFTCI